MDEYTHLTKHKLWSIIYIQYIHGDQRSQPNSTQTLVAWRTYTAEFYDHISNLRLNNSRSRRNNALKEFHFVSQLNSLCPCHYSWRRWSHCWWEVSNNIVTYLEMVSAKKKPQRWFDLMPEAWYILTCSYCTKPG